MGERVSILMVAGEVSGDRQGAFLARAILGLEPGVKLYGAGGDEMRSAGVDVRLKTSNMSAVGVQEGLSHLRSMHRAYREMRQLVQSERPDAAVLIDNETFSMALGRKLKQQGIPVILYFPPAVSIWGRWRARQVVRVADLIIAPFQAEVEPYRQAGARVVYVGHPLLDILKSSSDVPAAFTQAGLDPMRPTFALLPGSRVEELRRIAPAILSAAQIIKRRFPEVQIVIPVAAPHCGRELDRQLSSAGMTGEVTVVTGDIYPILGRCDVALVKAGTSTLEMALLSVPMVATYRLSALSYCVARLVAHTRFIAMPNILLGRLVVPELRQRQATAEKLAAAALQIFEDASYAAAIRLQLRRLRVLLGPEGAVDRAAALVLDEASRGRTGRELVRAAGAGAAVR